MSTEAKQVPFRLFNGSLRSARLYPLILVLVAGVSLALDPVVLPNALRGNFLLSFNGLEWTAIAFWAWFCPLLGAAGDASSRGKFSPLLRCLAFIALSGLLPFAWFVSAFLWRDVPWEIANHILSVLFLGMLSVASFQASRALSFGPNLLRIGLAIGVAALSVYCSLMWSVKLRAFSPPWWLMPLQEDQMKRVGVWCLAPLGVLLLSTIVLRVRRARRAGEISVPDEAGHDS